jgi:hypothetical protein
MASLKHTARACGEDEIIATGCVTGENFPVIAAANSAIAILPAICLMD